MMYCLRSYIPLLLLPLPLSLSPVHLTTLFALTYILNRPCIYCSLLLLILFASSCHWSGKCFVNLNLNPNSTFESDRTGFRTWWIPRLYTTIEGNESGQGNLNGTDMAGFMREVTNTTVTALANVALQGVKARLGGSPEVMEGMIPSDTGVGLGWIRSLLGRSNWTMPCTQYQIAL